MSTTASTTSPKKTSLIKTGFYLKFLKFLVLNKRAFSFEVSDRKFLLYTVDLLLLLLGTFSYCGAIYDGLSLQAFFVENSSWAISICLVWTLYSYIFDLYNLEHVDKFYSIVKYILVTSTLTVLTYILLPWFVPELPASRIVLLLFYINLTSSFVIWRYVYARTLYRPLFLKRIFIIGADWSSKLLIDALANGDVFNYHLGYKVVGILDHEDLAFTSYKGVKVISRTDEIVKLLKRLKIDEIILDDSARKELDSHTLKDLAKCHMQGMSVTSLNDFYEELTGRVMVHNTGQEFFLSFPYNKNHFGKAYHVFSRALDMLFGIMGVIACALVIPFVFVANLIWSRGPLFYTQERVGLYGKTFNITKLRSMVVDAEKNTGAAWATKNDQRVTAVGKFLRGSRIDELPQAWCVLMGDMSLIGPRPERPVFVKQLQQEIPFYETRHLIKPGITGWAQAIYKYGSNTDDALVKVQYDLYYLKNRSVMLDLKVILKTISVVIRFKGL